MDYINVLYSLFFPLIVSVCITSEQYNDLYSTHRAATPAERDRTVEKLRAELLDPYSVRDAFISNVLIPTKVIESSNTAKVNCVSQNAKNSYGAYVGQKY